ncbi:MULTISPECIES: signal peptidase I [Arthrobacter]|uniref:signal peptidase I n=1 Tax=Arthrobacter TaxID=1663 RepID=UPI0009EC3BE6|nr:MULTISPECIES: signal peptidase I [Arthrobacter]
MTTPEPTIRKTGRRAVEVLLWCGAGLGSLSIIAALAAVIFGIVPLVFTSGSMSPEVPTGSLGLARTVAASDLRVGDVVSVTASDKTRVTHRVLAVEQQSDIAALTLKGDANPGPDRETYAVTEADQVFFTAPYLGRIIMILTSPWGMFVGGLTAAALLLWAFRRQPSAGDDSDSGLEDETAKKPPEAPPVKSGWHRAHQRKVRIRATVLAVGIPALLLTTVASGTSAYFTDTAEVTTTGFVAHRVLQPGPATCTANANSITVGTTPLADPRYTYWARVYTPAGVAISDYKQMTGNPATARLNTSNFTPPLALRTTYTVRIHSRVGAPGPTGSSGWESQVFRRAEFSTTGTTLQCGAAIVPPNIVFTQPTNGFTGTKAQLQARLDRDCDRIVGGICGTAIDPNGTVVSVEYILQRTNIGTYCYVPGGNPNGYPAGGSCRYRSAERNGDTWTIPGNLFGGLIGWNYTLTIKATDNHGAVTEKAIEFRVTP